jgi:parallel beta-helix repeat protein
MKEKPLMKNRILIMIAGCLCGLFLAVQSGFAQGSLTPPGAPAPAMKSLSQIEPRTPVDATHTPGDSGDMFIISQPGSYYLTTNIIGVSSMNGIEILTNNVTLDLNGFSLSVVSGTPNGVCILNAQTNITVRHGSINGYNVGVYNESGSSVNIVFECLDVSDCGTGIFLLGAGVVRDCNCENNLYAGIVCSSGLVTGCTASNNGSVGIDVDMGTVSGCMAQDNYEGFFVDNSSTVSDCVANNSKYEGFLILDNDNQVRDCIANYNSGIGICLAGKGDRVYGCVANHNSGNTGYGIYVGGSTCQISGCVANYNATNGICVAGSRATVTECTATANSGAGIVVAGDSVVEDSHASANTSDGIRSSGSGNRLEHNQTRDNGGYGINSTFGPGGDSIMRNTAGGNGAGSYTPTSGSTFAPVQTPATATNPMANF